MSSATRRKFLALTAVSAARVLGANDRLRAAVIGVKGRGRVHMKCIHELAPENIELAAICDVDEVPLGERAAEFQKLSGGRPATHTDARHIIDDKSIDLVFHATPTHWHALAGLWSLQAGKDAYIEKPLAHNIVEGRKLVEAAARHKRIVQHGTQCRTSPEILEGVRKLQAGIIGDVFFAKGVGYKWRPSIGRARPQDPPRTLHYDRWLGPAAWKPYSENQLHYNWHWFWDTGNGDMGNIGVHGLDLIRLALQLEEHPTKIQAMGGHFMYDDDREAPDYQSASFQFANRKLIVQYEVRSGTTNTEAGMGDPDVLPFRLGRIQRDAQGVIFIGREGHMVFPDYNSYHVFLGQDRRPGPKLVGQGDPFSDLPHFRNFLKAVRSRKTSDLTADVRQGHLSSALCHLANIATRTGRTLEFDPKTEKFANDTAADRLLGRSYRKGYELPA